MEHITTYTGEDFLPLAPDADLIHIEDIAHALSMMCRANGHIKHFYSVAEHSINCAAEAKARGISAKIQKACLLHDASEAYLSDITRPVKKHLPEYLKAEERLQDIIYNKFLESPLTEDEEAIVSQIDYDMLVCEIKALMNKKVFDKSPDMKSEPVFEFGGFAEAEREFLRLFGNLSGKPVSRISSFKEQVSDNEN